MPTPSSQLHNAFLNLPVRIKEWLSSDQITFLLREITDRLGLGENKVAKISKLILRLAAQDLEPIDFINELAHDLDIGFQTAKTIAEDIEHKVLKPIESELRRDVGVDLKLIYFGKPSAQRAEPILRRSSGQEIPPQSEAPLAPKIPEPAPIPLEKEPTPPPAPPKPATSGPTEWEKLRKPFGAAQGKPSEPVVNLESFASPFILHQEGYTFPTKTPKAEPFLNVKVEKPLTKESEKPIPVRVEAPPVRVVHYNGLRTPINNAGLPKQVPEENRVDLRQNKK